MSRLPVLVIIDAAVQLTLAGRWASAASLLTAVRTDDPGERAALALALAAVAVDRDFGHRTDHATAALAAAGALLNGSSADAVPDGAWDLGLLQFRKDYSNALFREGTLDLRDRARVLIEQAPDDARRGAANFWAGAMADNVSEQPTEACAHYETALELGEKVGDELLMAQALRHLGHHAHAAGDLALARTQWERSTELLQKAGHLRPALAQQASLAVLLRDEGDVAGSRALATETNRWARQLNLPHIVQETAELTA
ncbi:hypothetical protein [Kribbella shirazensis]|uniref:Tetratricopeptide (TPR) repeat protein n=1 Tax=Kribbella shirazensis TaxID=1105143 RepID=A0A7X6A216_9ACTN|nr:hypothetical protein [Kribbella shirazensis]NIK58806.1 tetratricopeptide (TPR) repeat protein [Kribbella shirazensis]